MARVRDPATGRFVKQRAPVPRMAEGELRKLAARVVRNEVWVAWTAEQLELSFQMLLGLMDPKDLPPNACTMWADVSDRFPLAMNGMPMFYAGSWLCHEDLVDLHRIVVELDGMLGPST